MVVSQARSQRTVSGSKYKAAWKKKQHEMGRTPSLTRIEARKIKAMRGLGGTTKMRVLREETANLYDAASKRYVTAKILSVINNPANRHYTRRNIITKGTIISTDRGQAKVTSRPGQDGTVNAMLLAKK
ncbi:30S ribosomal protein S8e [Candidatus Woesearchaeota archaeon]|nr:30S ribosomal protein S8e [Candidatus Woesearchaeota archaeon]